MTNQERGRENSNSNFGQTLNQLLVKFSLDKSNLTSDISSMWPRDHFSFEIGKSEGVRKALIYILKNPCGFPFTNFDHNAMQNAIPNRAIVLIFQKNSSEISEIVTT